MIDPAGLPQVLDEKPGFAPESVQQNGNSFHHAQLSNSAKYTAPTMAPYGRARRKDKKDESPLNAFCSWLVKHQIGLAVNLITLLFMTHICFPRARVHTRKFFQLSYYNPASGEYRAGWNDGWLVVFWIVLFSGIRATAMEYILKPFAKKYGVKTAKDQVRFAEQGYMLMYDSVFWTLGMYILVNSDYFGNIQQLWVNWPNREVDGLKKWYILAQYAFWIQQIVVINIEDRRKDHWQMFVHHLITTTLLFTSYWYHQTKIANLILCVMDFNDVVLPLAKCIKYLGYKKICDYFFGLFVVSWFVARHIYYPMICWSLYTETSKIMNYGCYKGSNENLTGPFPHPEGYSYLLEPFFNPDGMICWDKGINSFFLGALLFLQSLLIIWFFMIIRVIGKVIKGGEAEDIRSGAEDEGEEKHEVPEEELQPYEEEVGVEGIHLNGRIFNGGKVRYRKANGSNGHSHSSDRKELLGRIGCDKGI